jgi:hypothetical protein
MYRISGSINIKYDGVVLRGEGQGESPSNSTIIYGTGNTPHQRTLVYVGDRQNSNTWKKQIGKKNNIEDYYLPAGSKTITLASVDNFNIGDQIVITHPCTEAWLESIEYGVGMSGANPWEVTDRYNIVYNRYITSVNSANNTITIDAPVFF